MFREKYQIKLTVEEIIAHLQRLIPKIIFLRTKFVNGMVGLDQIYISTSNFKSFVSEYTW